MSLTAAEEGSQSIYVLLTDRFVRTDGLNTAACDTDVRLDYIQGMGFTAIWITLMTGQLTEDTKYGEAYHGYWQQDIEALDSNHGTPDDLKALAVALHKCAMYLMPDVVANYLGSLISNTNTIAKQKGDDGSQAITVLTNLGVGGKEYSLSIPDTGFKAGDKLTRLSPAPVLLLLRMGRFLFLWRRTEDFVAH
ncbi:hypothetical protein N7447_002057 [Penicillium robsamsonii]|uniref:uncharacterized protein n=1 Tax=Penicillium robsamsonii TaxID=1792511 RepID=UPI0025489C56|nr:uncharacterized protein N7447_002057 [Penicillium robsamsonii]KAJ5836031.1 hypothetical protein N7447_002057 [Penicillium robsamsonii]